LNPLELLAPKFGVIQYDNSISFNFPPEIEVPPRYDVVSVKYSLYVGICHPSLQIFLTSVAAYQLYKAPYLIEFPLNTLLAEILSNLCVWNVPLISLIVLDVIVSGKEFGGSAILITCSGVILNTD
jgi:hypothetical protein